MRSSSAVLTSLSLFPALGLAFQFHVKVEPVNVVTDRNPSAIRAYYNQWLNRDAEGTPNQGLVTITKDPWRGFQDEPGVGRGVNFETYSSLAGEDDRFKSFDEWITREDGRIKSMDYFEMKMEGGSGDNLFDERRSPYSVGYAEGQPTFGLSVGIKQTRFGSFLVGNEETFKGWLLCLNEHGPVLAWHDEDVEIVKQRMNPDAEHPCGRVSLRVVANRPSRMMTEG